MIRCKHDVNSLHGEKKRSETPTGDAAPTATASDCAVPFACLFAGHAHRWASAHDADALRSLASEARVKLRHAEYGRFVTFVEGRHGTARARQAGLPVGPPRLTVAS